MKQGDWQTAIDDYRDALAFGLEAQDAAGARNNICWFLSLDGQAEEALPYCEQAVEASPSCILPRQPRPGLCAAGPLRRGRCRLRGCARRVGVQPEPADSGDRRCNAWNGSNPCRAGENPLTPDVLASAAGRGRARAPRQPGIRLIRPPLSFSCAGASTTCSASSTKRTRPIRDAIELDPEYALAYFYRGMVDLWQEDWEDALADMQRVVLLDPDQAYAHHVSRPHAHARGGLREAIPSLSAAIDLRPDETDFYADRAAAYFSLGERRECAGRPGHRPAPTTRTPPQMLFIRGAAHRMLDNRGAAIADLETRARTRPALRAGRTGAASSARAPRGILLAFCEKSLPLGRSGGTGPSPTDGSTERGHFLPCHPLMRRGVRFS